MKAFLIVNKYLLAGLILFQFQFATAQNENNVYLFAYFKSNGEGRFTFSV